MRIRIGKSHIMKNCAVCNARTASSNIFEENDISIRIPICDRTDSDCQSKALLKVTARDMLEKLKQEVTK